MEFDIGNSFFSRGSLTVTSRGSLCELRCLLSSLWATSALYRYPHTIWKKVRSRAKEDSSRASCKSMECRMDNPRTRSRAIGSQMRLRDEHFVGSHGRVFDIVVVSRPGRDPKGPRMTTLEATLFESGRPVLIAPQVPRARLARMFWLRGIAAQSKRAPLPLRCPILKRAGRVVVLTVEGGAAVPGPTGEQLCRYLQLNGVAAKPLTVGLGGRLTGDGNPAPCECVRL